jgi:predicted signal transduction protein with EAL and GGDEF domain
LTTEGEPESAAGVKIAIDDIGAGYSSLNHVLRLRPDIIKLDRDLVVDLETDRARRALVTALVLLALEVGASVTGAVSKRRGSSRSCARSAWTTRRAT